jgi:hypothetical protein
MTTEGIEHGHLDCAPGGAAVRRRDLELSGDLAPAADIRA